MKENQFYLRIAQYNDAAEIHDIMESVYNSLEDKSLFVCDDLDFVKRHIENHGFIVVACNTKGRIAACLIVRFPFDEEDNLGLDINLKSEELKRVAHIETAVVLPEYRGNGLQHTMIKFAEDNIDKNLYEYCFATVSPNNPASCHSFEKSEYSVVITKEKYDGLLRRIYMKKI